MKTLSSFMSRILPHVAGCPDVVAEEALVDTAIEFCEKTLVVQQSLYPMDTVAGVLEYEFVPPRYQMVIMPVGVWFKTQKLEAVPADAIRSVQAYNINVPGHTELEGDPRQYFWTAANTIGVYPVPKETVAASLTVRVALKPTRSATQLENVLFDDWVDVLVAGTLARLHAMKDQTWASSERGLLRGREFRAGLQRARMESSVGRVRASLSVRMRGF